ncbi:MAG: NfeD family protein [Planctomycetota bacterium]|jgi:membrane protein implicated in regulation of membrane protease activity
MDWMKDFMEPKFIWAIVGLVLLLMEFALPGFVIFFFGIGAWVVSGVCFFLEPSLNVQLIIFVVSSVFLLLTLRKLLQSVFVGHTSSKQKGNVDLQDIIGHHVVVRDEIVPPLPGSVELNGVKWKALANVKIEAGQVVEVVDQDSITLIVKPLD